MIFNIFVLVMQVKFISDINLHENSLFNIIQVLSL